MMAISAYNSVFIGYIVTVDWFAYQTLRAKKARKWGMVEISRQHADVPRYAGVVGGTDNGR